MAKNVELYCIQNALKLFFTGGKKRVGKERGRGNGRKKREGRNCPLNFCTVVVTMRWCAVTCSNCSSMKYANQQAALNFSAIQ